MGIMKTGYHMKINHSIFEWGFTVPIGFTSDFLQDEVIPPGTSERRVLVWGRKKYEVKLSHVNRTQAKTVYQIRWDSNKELLTRLRQTFIQSYVILKSQKELFDVEKEARKHFRTSLEGGQQEVIVFKPISQTEIKVKEFIRIENEWNPLFQRLVRENVLNWVFEKEDKEYLIQKSTKWHNVKEFAKHKNAINVVYYLAHSSLKLLYIGKADELGKRVKPGMIHQSMPADWDMFKYDIIRPEFSSILERIEDHTIRTVASILSNSKGYSSLGISEYMIVNKTWKKL